MTGIARRMSPPARAAMGALVTLALLALVVPALASVDPLAIDDVVGARLVAPMARDAAGALHPLGTDRFGRDILVRMLLAARISLTVGVVGSLLATVVGVAVGAMSGWWRGATDRAAMAVADTLLAVPRLILLLLCATLWGPGTMTVIVVLALTGWMSVARLVRAEVQLVATRPFIEGARATGVPEWRTLWRHVLPNAVGPAIVALTLGVGNAMLLESGLAFLGLGVQPPTPSWGNMIAGGRDLIVTAPWVALAPGLALIATVLACTVLGDAWRETLAGDTARALGERA
ncbi:MAG: ABC transporter permease [Gemmatimonadaceae bacterium]|nr:ABC transporter permease [Gemmatimonadaceae bacterium]